MYIQKLSIFSLPYLISECSAKPTYLLLDCSVRASHAHQMTFPLEFKYSIELLSKLDNSMEIIGSHCGLLHRYRRQLYPSQATQLVHQLWSSQLCMTYSYIAIPVHRIMNKLKLQHAALKTSQNYTLLKGCKHLSCTNIEMYT